MKSLPFEVHEELEGWRLFWARLTVDSFDAAAMAERRSQVAADARQRFGSTGEIASHPTAASLRRLFRAAGCDPTRYRPASEALLRRLIKGSELPAIQPLVDLNNCLSTELAVPCCVMVEGSVGRSLVWRSGRTGEAYESLRGPFNLENKPVLVDEEGPLDTPITGNTRVMVHPETHSAWLVAYLPADEITHEQAWETLDGLQEGLGIAVEPFV